MSKESSFGLRLQRHWISAVLFLIPLGLSLLGSIWHLPETIQHVLLTLSAVMGIHVLDRLFLVKDTEGSLEKLTAGIRHDITEQTESLLSMSKSLEVMDHCGIVQLYPSRADAANDICSDVVDPGNAYVRIMGISLNDFVQGMDQNLLRSWRAVQDLVHGRTPINDKERGLKIQFLIIDPNCFGAVLRSESESENSSALAKRLSQDVTAAARDLLDLEDASNPANTGVTFECHLYRIPPILFLCWMDPVCYVQQYHFWSSRDNQTPTPVLKYRQLPASRSTYPYHEEMEHHFNWIWENASIPVKDFLDGAAVGIENGMHQCGAVNVYTNPEKARDRIVHLLKNAKSDVAIQGISLNSYFSPGPLREALHDIIVKGDVELKVLLLKPDCRQAKLRSYRERLIESASQEYDDYVRGGAHENSDLYHDTHRTIQNIRNMLSDIRSRQDKKSPVKLRVGLYDSAPACFVLRIDGHMLVEQYHYGKIVRETKAILGKDMPLIEYTESISHLYTTGSDPLRRPFGLLINHFDFAMKQSKALELSKEEAEPDDAENSGQRTQFGV